MAIIEGIINSFVRYYKIIMNKTHQNKVKKPLKKEIQTSTTRLIKHKDRHHYQTSTATFVINIHGESTQEQIVNHLHQQKILPNKKIKFINEDFQCSRNLQNARSLGTKKERALKCSTLNDIEDLNVYSKGKSQKKQRKNGQKHKRPEKIRQNPRSSVSNGNLKIRGIKSQSKSYRQLQPKAFSYKSLEKQKKCNNKSKAPSQLNDNSTEIKDKSKKCQNDRPQMAEIQNSYYFQIHEQKVNQVMKFDQEMYKRDQGIQKKGEVSQRKIKKKSMYLFESGLQEWKEPTFNIKALESTRDLLN